MYKYKEEENYMVIDNKKRKFRILDYKEPNQINIVVLCGTKNTQISFPCSSKCSKNKNCKVPQR